MKRFAAVLSFLVVLASIGNAQTILLTTTLSSAVGNTVSSALTTGNMGVISLASATGVSGPMPNTGNVAGLATSNASTYLYVDRELMQVESVNGTFITVARGVGSTSAASHASGALVFVIPAPAVAYWSGGSLQQNARQGSCSRTQEIYLPIIQFSSGIITDCQGGQYVNGDTSQTTRGTFYRLEAPTIGAVSNAAVIGTNSTAVAAELYCTEVRMPYSRLLTGYAPHIGTTGGTDKWIVALYDSGGNLLANSALAGTTVGSGNAWQATAFTSPYYAVGPSQYYACLMSNGTTATIDTVTTGKDDNILTFKSASAGTFGTLPNFTAPTAFNSVSGAYGYLY
ncbi:hypothetical protein ACFPT7_02155 [Acidicapsa dinghuensis]|uniref:Uncharacterized protein n=1 Tax=Acidicapsa dinghuensis TaxID=2218256 RepID=A0ABW1EDN0_9BACT|nr:hypothetical protein [Acidicapsa dinghuensis]